MNLYQIKKTVVVTCLVSLHACSNPEPTQSRQSVPVTATVKGDKFALTLPEIPGMATIGSEAKLKIVKGRVKFTATPSSCPEGTKSQLTNPSLTTTNLVGSTAAELASPFKAGQLIGPVTLQPGDFTVNLEIFERNLLAYFGTAQFSVQSGIITNLDLVLQKPFACPKPDDGGVVINPGIPDGGVTINPVVPTIKKSACDFTGPITKECNVDSAYCEWKDPNTVSELDNGGLNQANARCSAAAAKQALINQLCERNIMVGEKFLEEIYCSVVPIEPPPPVEEANKVSPFNGAISVTRNGETIIKQDLTGFKEAAIITVRGLAGDRVIWSNSVNSKTIETILDGRGDYDDRGHYIDFGLQENPAGNTNGGDFDDIALSNECGTQGNQLTDQNAVEFEQSFTSLPAKIMGTQMGINFEVTTQAKLSISSSPKRSIQTLKMNVISANSAAASGSGLMGMLAGLLGSGPLNSHAASQAMTNSGTTILDSLLQNEWATIADSKNDQYHGLYCAAKGGRTITLQNETITGKIQFSPAILSAPSPLASIERLRKELGKSRTFNVTANIQDGIPRVESVSVQGVTTVSEISPVFDCQGVTKKADIAYEFVNEFPGGAHKVGLLKRQSFYIDSQKKRFVAIIQESDKIDPKLKTILPPICLLSDQETSTGSSTPPSQESVTPSEPKYPVAPPEEDIIAADDGQKQELVDLEFHVTRLPDKSWFQHCIFAQVMGQPEVELGCNRIAPRAALAPLQRIVKMKMLTNTCNQIRLYLKTNSGSGLRTIVSSEIPGRTSSGVSRSKWMAGGPGINLVPLGGGGYVIEANDNNDPYWQDLQLRILPNIRPDTKFTFENTGIPCQ
jgi:hypothetical protein